MNIALGQMAVLSTDLQQNYNRAVELVISAKQKGADIIVLPQLVISGVYAGDNWLDKGFIDDCLYWGDKLAEKAQGISIIFGNIAYDGKLENACYLAQDGLLKRLPAFVAASNFPDGDRFFAGHDLCDGQIMTIALNGRSYRAAFLMGDWQAKELPSPIDDAEIIFNLAQIPLILGHKFDYSAIAKKYGCPYVFANSCTLVGSGKAFWLCPGGSSIYDANGHKILSAPLFTDGVYMGNEITKPLAADECIYKACVFGVKNFMSSIGVSKAVIGLSGGIDSALAACIYIDALGGENVLLINMPSRYNSDITQSLSHQLANALKAHYAVIPIEQSWQATINQFEDTIITAPDQKEWKISITPAVAENIQARDRSARILAAAAAAWNAVFTCNSNKAELTVGYATFYGDLAGAFAATADLWKHEVYQAAAFAQKVFPAAASYLQSIASIRPSAELSLNQAVEEGKGDPLLYPYHDYLLRSWVEEKATPADILSLYINGVLEENIGCQKNLLKKYFPDSEQFIADLEYWWKMYRRTGTAKRIQSPPLLALSAHPFGEAKGEVQAVPYFSRHYLELKEQLK
ncbi:MAG: NAD(+) synthase [Bacillota bacterium]|jgi:NAD+ synthase (glutamine-hydrolysing)